MIVMEVFERAFDRYRGDLERGSRQTRRDSRLNRGMEERPGKKLTRGQASIPVSGGEDIRLRGLKRRAVGELIPSWLSELTGTDRRDEGSGALGHHRFSTVVNVAGCQLSCRGFLLPSG